LEGGAHLPHIGQAASLDRQRDDEAGDDEPFIV
jgi:hypothetical protein